MYGSILFLSLSLPRPASAVFSASPNFKNSRSEMNTSGIRQSSTGYFLTSALGGLAVDAALASPSYLARSGLVAGYYYPGRILDLTPSACIPGQVALDWTAPGDDGQAPGTFAKSFVVKMSTDPAFSPSISESFFFRASTAPSAPPPAAVRGSARSMIIAGLVNGVTYYINVQTLEKDGTPGPLSVGVTVLVAITGPTLTDFTGQTGFKVSLLDWQALNGFLSPSCQPSAYVLYRSTLPNTGFAPILTTNSTSYVDSTVAVGDTYYYELFALNSSSQQFGNSNIQLVYVRTAPTLPPLALDLDLSGSTATITWDAPKAYNFGLPFGAPHAAQPDELTGYRVWRSTGLTGAPWQVMAVLSSTTLQWSDPSAAPRDFYRVTAINLTEESVFGLILDGLGNGYMTNPVGTTHLSIPKSEVANLTTPTGEYWLRGTTMAVASTSGLLDGIHPQSIYSSARFDVMLGSNPVTDSFAFKTPAKVRMGYTPTNGMLTSSYRMPDQSAVYWYNGKAWMKLYGGLDPVYHYMTAEVERGGSFELRALERTQDFNFDKSGLSNRLITPNGDGLNDVVVFTVDNPRDSQITGKIFDMKGALVADIKQTSTSSLTWDAKANGQPVPGGVYIYQLEGDGKVFTGTVVVIK